MKRIVLFLKLLLIGVIVLFTSMPVAAYDFQSAGIYYNIGDNNTVSVTSGNQKYTGNISIPKEVTYNGVKLSVTSIGEWAFDNCSGLTSVIIPNSVTSIGRGAFSGCSGLTSVSIPNSVTSIGGGAFSGCSGLTSVSIPNSVTSIGGDAFYFCSGLTSVTIPNSVTSIGTSAFYFCSGLTSVTISNSVTSIADATFWGCSGLTSVTIPNSVTSIGTSAFAYCSDLTSVTIPNSVTFIGSHAFWGCSGLTSIIIPNSVTSIGGGAFSGCSGLTSVTIPSSVTSIGEETFGGCSGLTSITIPSSVTTIGNDAFSGCSGLTSITIPSSVTEIGNGAFWGCSGLGFITIPCSVTSIGYGAFSYCSDLTCIEVESENTRYDSRNDCNAIIITDSNTLLCGCMNSTIPNGVTTIGNGAFSGCSGLTSITIPNSVTSIGDWAFSGCSGMTSITIPSSVTSIGDDAFMGCTKLSYVYSDIQAPFIIAENVFSGISTNAKLQVPKGTKSKYEAFSGWTYNFKEIVEAESDLNIYELSIKATGNGSATYDGTTIRSTTSSFTVNEGTNAVITFTPDNGYQIKSIKAGPTDDTASVLTIGINGNWFVDGVDTGVSSQMTGDAPAINIGGNGNWFADGKYTIGSISENTIVEVEFEAIPITNCTLSISTYGGGYVYYDGETIRNRTSYFTINEGSYVTINITPDDGYRISSVKENGYDVTSSVWNNQYSLGSIYSNTTIEIEFEAIPVTTYSLSIKTIGNGSVSYEGITVRNQTNTFIVDNGLSATITFTPDNGYRIKSVKENNTDVTSYVSNNTYVVKVISRDTNIEVEFEAIPATTYTLSIKATGNGLVSYEGTTVRNQTNTFTVNEGTSVTITLTPDNGYQIKSVKVNSYDDILNVSNNQYTISNISQNTTLEVEFAEKENDKNLIDGHEYVDLGLPSGKYWSTVNYGANHPEYAGKYVSSSSFNEWGEYWRTPTKEEMQELIDECEWAWTEQNGYNGFIIKGINNNTMFLPAAGYYDQSVHNINIGKQQIGSTTLDEEYVGVNKVAYYHTNSDCYFVGNNSEIQFSNSSLGMTMVGVLTYIPIRPISTVRNESVFTKDGLNYSIVSQEERTVKIAKGNYGKVLDVPQIVTYPDKVWSIIGIDDDVLDNEELSAIIWNPEVSLTNNINNPNLLLYVKSASYVPNSMKNVIVNNVADNITLADAANGNNFYCPQEFTAKSISYSHHYKMGTGINESKGWETITLPFDVKKISHSSKGEIVPFANWKSGDSKKPFWLMQLGSNGWIEANGIKAYTPYIISMPNHEKYKSDFNLNGDVTFSAENVKIGKTENLSTSSYNGRTFVPNFSLMTDRSCYALNVNNDYLVYQGEKNEGSVFFIGLRDVHPFEAYMTTASGTRAIAIDDDLTTGIGDIAEIWNDKIIRVYNLSGQLLMTEENKSLDEIKKMLSAGVYIVNGKKIITK